MMMMMRTGDACFLGLDTYREAVVQATIDCTGMAICIVDLKGHNRALWRWFLLDLPQVLRMSTLWKPPN